MSIQPKAAVFRNETQPEWGNGLVVEDQPDKWVLMFEHGGRKLFKKAMAKTLVPVTLDPGALVSLQTKVLGRHAARAAGLGKPRKPQKTAALFASFEEQLKFFEKQFPGGFEGDRFLTEERGVPGATGKVGYKKAAIALAQEHLSAEAFRTATPAELFESAKRVLASTNIIFPIEGAIPFRGIIEFDRPAMLEGLKELLHGTGEYGTRLEHFAAAVTLKDKTGKGKRPSWPLATAFGALYAPTEYCCVKPTAFAAQATTFGQAIEKTQPVTAVGYRQFFEVATLTQKKLKAAGQNPKDLVDVYSFIWRTHAEKPA